MSGFYDGQHIPPLDQMTPKQATWTPDPEVTAGQDAARALERIAGRYTSGPIGYVSSLQRDADQKELRLIAEAALELARAL